MYLTETEKTTLLVNVGRLIADSKLIKGVIARDKISEAKSDMKDGENYYNGKHDILDKDFRKYTVQGTDYVDENAANNKVPNPFHSELVDQKVEYILSNQISIEPKQDKLAKHLETFNTRKLHKVMRDMATYTSNKGVEWLHPFINEQGEFDYVIIPAIEIVPDYDATYNRTLMSVMRYYDVDVMEGEKLTQTTRVEIWDSMQVHYYILTNKEFVPDPSEPVNPRPHMFVTFKQGDEVVNRTGKSWGFVPFIKLANNSREYSDLKRIKPLIDVYDLVISDYANNIEDIQEAIWNLKGYEGTNLKEFMTNLRTFKAIKTSTDGGVEPHTLTIPTEAKNELLKILKSSIYAFGRGVDLSDEAFAGNVAGVALKFKFARLDMKANALIDRIIDVIAELFKFYLIIKEPNFAYTPDMIDVTFSKKMLINETEQIMNVINSKGAGLPPEVYLPNHPWVKNVQETMDQIAKMNEDSIDLDQVTDND